tara:strand:+ start:90 stop:710 length:621 start_codon:yes stop_codon:yes gene_type:complete
MALIDNYCSLASVHRETGNSDADLEDWFEECINKASRWIDDYCLRDFLSHDYSSSPFTVPERDAVGDTLFLDWPIVTLTKVTAGSDDGEVDTGLYNFNVKDRSVRLRDGNHWIGKATPANQELGNYSLAWQVTNTAFNVPIKLTGTFGYTTPPPAINTACTRIASAWSHEKRRESVAPDGNRVSILNEQVPSEVEELLKRFRRLVH